jgi:hypothetical protein
MIGSAAMAARPEAVSWLSREASKINSKRIFVLNVNELTGQVRRRLCGTRLAADRFFERTRRRRDHDLAFLVPALQPYAIRPGDIRR